MRLKVFYYKITSLLSVHTYEYYVYVIALHTLGYIDIVGNNVTLTVLKIL